jgi:hypothetical protein
MTDRRTAALVFLTFLGMVGLYVGLWLAYKKYQEYAPTIQADIAAAQNAGSSVTGLLSALKGG